jgi:P-type Mg2+ transporter
LRSVALLDLNRAPRDAAKYDAAEQAHRPRHTSLRPSRNLLGLPAEAAFKALASTPEGLSEAEAGVRKRRLAGQALSHQSAEPAPKLLRQCSSSIVLILIGAALLAGVPGDVGDCLIILGIVVASGLLSVWQEFGAGRAIVHLLGRVAVKASFLRSGQLTSVSLDAVIPGDIALLAAGDLVPGDGLLL